MIEFENELHQEYKLCSANLIARIISVYYRYFGSELELSYKEIYDKYIKIYKYDEKEQEEIFDKVDNILNEEYNLLIAKKDKLVLVDLTEGDV